MASKEANISALYTELSRLGQSGEYERAIKTTNKILQQSPDEEEAFHCKIVCLIQLSKFYDALQTINRQPKLSKNLIFEKAYCQYRLNQPGEAYKTVDVVPNLDQKLRELKAQILYRLERYDECFELYKSIIKNSSDDFEDEREANLSAVMANLCMENSTRELPKLREHTFELTYNAACQLVGKGLYAEAEKKLKVAEKLCRETLEEDGASEEDIEAEMGIIMGQLAYCLQMQNQDKEAQAIYNSLLKSKPTDIGLVAVASNNSVTINKDENVFDSKKKMKSATADGVEHKLTKAQRKIIALNQCLLTIYTNQADHGKQLCAKLTEAYPECAADSALVQATQMTRDNRCKEAVGFLKKFAENHKDKELELKLACVQLLLSTGDKKEACRVLESLGDNVNRAGIISALVTLYLSDSNLDKASSVFKNAVDWYKNRASKQGDLSALWRQAADFHLRNGDPQVAANSLEELLRLNPSDNKTLAQLVTAYAMFDPAKAQSISKKLPPFNVPHSADIEMLESSNWLMSTKIIKKVTKVEASPKPGALSDDELRQRKKKKNRKRKGKLPKDYEEGVMPDPERWLPKYERTGFKKKKDRRNKDIGKGTQGAASGASDMYDITKMPSHASKSSPNPSSPAAESQGPRQQQKRFQQKKKKKVCFVQNFINLRFKLDNYFDKSRLTLQDYDFVGDVESDVISFAEGRKEKRVLVFPPVNNHRRFLIHKLVHEQFPTLATFSIGEGEDRRPVICFKSDYIQPPVAKPKVVEERSPKIAETYPAQPKRERRSYAMPSIGIYRPPAARRLEEQNSNAQEREQIKDSINGKHECKCPSEVDESGKKRGVSVITPLRTENGSSKTKSPDAGKKSESASKSVRQRRPDMKVYVPKGRRLASAQDKQNKPSKEVPPQGENGSVRDSGHLHVVTPKNDGVVISEELEETECKKIEDVKSSEKCSVRTAQTTNLNVKTESPPHVSPTSLWIEAQNDVEEDEERKKLTCRPPVPSEVSNGSSDSNSQKDSVDKMCDGKEDKRVADSIHLNPEECDWESMFDDNGECLDPSLMEQLSTAVGTVTIEKPKSNYDTFKMKTLDMVSNDFPHVIEIYNFPPEFRLQDLMTVFSQFKNAGFEIKWVDDTHALGIFSNSQIVSEVLAFRHPFVKTRMLKDGTVLSKEKARRSAEHLLPYKPRPDTCPALARRLVTGALGVKLPTSREEREAERKILKEAREKKRLEAKQREEAWEGNFNLD